MTLETAREHIGSQVIYRPHPNARTDQGVITSINGRFVLVRYTGGRTSLATYPEDLELVAP